MAVAHGFPALADHPIHKGTHAPVRLDLRHPEQKIAEHGLAVRAVRHFRMELKGVDASCLVLHGGHVQRGRAARYGKAGGRRFHLVPVRHPHAGGLAPAAHGEVVPDAVPQRAAAGEFQIRRAVFPRFGLGEFASQIVREKLHAVADAQHRHAQLQQPPVQGGGILFPHAGRAAGKDDGVRLHGRDLFRRGHAGMDFGIYARLAHAARDKLGHL